MSMRKETPRRLRGRKDGPERSSSLAPEDREQIRQAAIREYARAAAPIMSDLHAAGIRVDSLDALQDDDHEIVAPILLFWLPRVDSYRVKESLVRYFTARWARGVATRALLDAFCAAPMEEWSLRWTIGNAMYVISDKSASDDILRIVEDPSNGRSREMFVVALGRVGHPRAVPVLLRLLDDDSMVGHAAIALGLLRAKEAKPALEKLTDHPNAWVRKEAGNAIKRIDRAARSS